jgi:hypothetical protein
LTALGLTPGAHCTSIMTKVQDRRAKTAYYQQKLSTKSKRKYKTKSASKAQLVAQATESCCGYQSRVRLDLGSDGVIILEAVSWLVREVERLAEEEVRREDLEEKMAKKKLRTAQAAAAPPCKHCNQPFSTGRHKTWAARRCPRYAEYLAELAKKKMRKGVRPPAAPEK